MPTPGDSSRADRRDAGPTAADDRLIFLAEALTLVPFSDTTLRRAISRGELEAWQPHGDGKLVLWRSALIEWATRRPAGNRTEPTRSKSQSDKITSRRPRRAAAAIQRPDPITLADLG